MRRVLKCSFDDNGRKLLTVSYRDSDAGYINKYIHKYFLSAEDKGKLFPVDLDALEMSIDHDGLPNLWKGIIPKVVNECTIFYQDISLDKRVDRDLARRGLLAVAAYHKDHGAELTPEEVRTALNLNEWLRGYEKTLLDKQLSIEQELKNRLSEKDPFLVDYEIHLRMDFYLREDDPFHDNDDANEHDWDNDASLMFTLKNLESYSPERKYAALDCWGLGDDQDHNDVSDSDNPVYQAKHCKLFRELTNYYYGVPIKHFNRIGTICAHFEVIYQNAEKFVLKK